MWFWYSKLVTGRVKANWTNICYLFLFAAEQRECVNVTRAATICSVAKYVCQLEWAQLDRSILIGHNQHQILHIDIWLWHIWVLVITVLMYAISTHWLMGKELMQFINYFAICNQNFCIHSKIFRFILRGLVACNS